MSGLVSCMPLMEMEWSLTLDLIAIMWALASVNRHVVDRSFSIQVGMELLIKELVVEHYCILRGYRGSLNRTSIPGARLTLDVGR